MDVTSHIWVARSKDRLLTGRGRLLYANRFTPKDTARFAQAAQNALDDLPFTPTEKVLLEPLMVSLLAMAEVQPTELSGFSSVQEVAALFEEEALEETAINILNAQRLGANQADPFELLADIHYGHFLQLPRDRARLYTTEVQMELPGIVVVLLKEKQASKAAFSNYLRRGAPPIIPTETLMDIAATRPTLCSFGVDRRRERELIAQKMMGGHA